MLELQELRFAIPGRYEILCNGRIGDGEILCLSGPSGIGKTTLLRALAGFHPLQSGRIILNGQDLAATPPEERHSGFLFQSHRLFPGMDVLENLEFPLRVRHPDWTKELRRAKALALLQKTGLASLADQGAQQVSGGEAQRLAFCRVLLSEPKFFLLDEPFSALDPENRQNFRRWLKEELKERARPTLMVTHDADDIRELGARVFKWPPVNSGSLSLSF